MRKENFKFISSNKLFAILLKVTIFIFVLNVNLRPAFAKQDNEILELSSQNQIIAQNTDTTVTEEISFQPENEEVIRRHITVLPRFYVGLKLGLTTGTGVAFGMDRLYDKLSAEGTVFVLKSNNFSTYSVGASLKYALLDDEKKHIYINYGLSYNYWSVNKNDNKLSSPFRTGLGLGYMQFFSNNFAFDVSILATYFTGDGSIYPVPQVGIQYHFRD